MPWHEAPWPHGVFSLRMYPSSFYCAIVLWNNNAFTPLLPPTPKVPTMYLFISSLLTAFALLAMKKSLVFGKQIYKWLKTGKQFLSNPAKQSTWRLQNFSLNHFPCFLSALLKMSMLTLLGANQGLELLNSIECCESSNININPVLSPMQVKFLSSLTFQGSPTKLSHLNLLFQYLDDLTGSFTHSLDLHLYTDDSQALSLPTSDLSPVQPIVLTSPHRCLSM